MRCIDPDCLRRANHRHHVVYEQELKRRWRGRDGDRRMKRWTSWARLYNDPRNIVDMCFHHHFRHHDGSADEILPLRWLPDEALEFAFELLGPFAYDYLRRHYEGDDLRLESHLAAATQAA